MQLKLLRVLCMVPALLVVSLFESIFSQCLLDYRNLDSKHRTTTILFLLLMMSWFFGMGYYVVIGMLSF